ncbi:MAG TPA: site-2 protease family protein [Caldilineaceae bacterium]|nr:site-2 protease family protein [Caldilineaceae bacterium]
MTEQTTDFLPPRPPIGPVPGVQPVSSWETDPTIVRVRQVVQGDLAIDSIQTPSDPAREGVLVLRGRLLRPSHEVFAGWVEQLRPLGYTPLLRRDGEEQPDRVAVHLMAGVPPKAHPRVWINVVLFVLTVLSTLFVGSLYGGDLDGVSRFSDLLRPANLLSGWPFAATLLGILAAHEFGHYFMARYHRVAVTLPYFIPMPFGFGTLGAFIQLKEPILDRRKLFDIGVAGPLAGLVVAVPLLFVGLSTSPVDVPPTGVPIQLEGNSLLYYFAKIAVFGRALPDPVTGEDVFMNQVTFAAWIGLLVTALNLLPVGQLDGGHTVYALFGRASRHINRATIAAMAVLAVAGLEQVQELVPALSAIGFTGWFMWLILIGVVLGAYHPPALDDVTELDSNRRLIGYLVILCFVATFVPVPMRLIT